MSEYLPKEVRQGLDMARRAARTSRSRLRVRVGDRSFTILREWDDGFALDAADAGHLRGLVDVYDGTRHISNCLIIASEEEAGEMKFEFKRMTLASTQPPADYDLSDTAPIALLSRD